MLYLYRYSNEMFNSKPVPQLSWIEIGVAIGKENYNPNSTIDFLKKMYNYLAFDYGYIVDLSSKHDFFTERKLKTGLLGTTSEITEIDHRWSFHLPGIKEGYVKKFILSIF
jgi:hypothetical protein